MRYAFFPGCSLAHSASAYADSIRLVAEHLGLEVMEIDDWNCCGATAYFATELLPAYALVARNLALLDGDLDQVVTPCSLCYVNLRRTLRALDGGGDLRAWVDDALAAGGLSYRRAGLSVRHLLDVVVNDVGVDSIAAKVTRPLYGLRVAPYYGCLTVRPGTGFDDPEQPASLDRLLRALGAEVVDFSLKADCCGGHMSLISAEVAYSLLRRLLQHATQQGADLVVTVCPMCQLNLDAHQQRVNRHFGTDFRLPVLFFTQAIGLALGMSPEALGIGREIVPAAPVLEHRWSTEPPSAPERRERPRRRRRDGNLPVPRAGNR
jgi:heterodisulfide reductase subunit B